jgi:hypothetical protein
LLDEFFFQTKLWCPGSSSSSKHGIQEVGTLRKEPSLLDRMQTNPPRKSQFPSRKSSNRTRRILW